MLLRLHISKDGMQVVDCCCSSEREELSNVEDTDTENDYRALWMALKLLLDGPAIDSQSSSQEENKHLQ